jgi:SAM-dependent methyltransferase
MRRRSSCDLMAPDPTQFLPPHRYEKLWRRKRLEEGLLPDRYRQPWAERFDELIEPALKSGISVLDVGSGREPVLALEARPRLTYVGLDVSSEEIEQAPARAYDEVVIRALGDPDPDLCERFDLIVSWQVFEHVPDMTAAIHNMRRYLKPGGRLVALFSGRYSPMALLNRGMSPSFAKRLNHSLLGREPDSMFIAHYDRCYASAVRTAFRDWTSVQLEPRWEAAAYFDFAMPVFQTYLAIENRMADAGWEDLATHYFLSADR